MESALQHAQHRLQQAEDNAELEEKAVSAAAARLQRFASVRRLINPISEFSMLTSCRSDFGADILCRSQDLLKDYRTAAETAERELPAARAAFEGATSDLDRAKGQGEALASRLQGLQMSVGHLAAASSGSRPPPHRMLHECFRIRDPRAFDGGLLPALDAIMGERACTCACCTTSTCFMLLMHSLPASIVVLDVQSSPECRLTVCGPTCRLLLSVGESCCCRQEAGAQWW